MAASAPGEGHDRLLRRIALRWHRFCAASPERVRVYGYVLHHLRRVLPAEAARHLANNLTGVSWPPVELPPEAVIVGDGTVINLHPHFGEFDLEALVSRRLTYEAPLFRWLEPRVADYDVIVEIGANVGVFTVFFERLLQAAGRRDARVVAFEPAPEAFRRLERNLRANAATHVTPVEAAIAEVAGPVAFYEPRGHLTNGSLLAGFAAQFAPEVTSRHVRAVSGDEVARLVGEAGRVLVKIDVEGAEARVLDALAPFVAARRPDLILEVLPGQAEAIAASLPLRTGAYRYFELGSGDPVERDRLSAGAERDWWLVPREAR